MAKLASKQKRISDIVVMLEKGMERKQILQKLAKTVKVSNRTLDHEMKEAKEILARRNAEKEAIRQDSVSTVYKEQLNSSIISDIELESVLCAIATGSLKVEEIVRGGALIRGVSPIEQIAAIDKIFKKRGLYVTKVAKTDGHGNDVPSDEIDYTKLDNKVLMAILKARKPANAQPAQS